MISNSLYTYCPKCSSVMLNGICLFCSKCKYCGRPLFECGGNCRLKLVRCRECGVYLKKVGNYKKCENCGCLEPTKVIKSPLDFCVGGGSPLSNICFRPFSIEIETSSEVRNFEMFSDLGYVGIGTDPSVRPRMSNKKAKQILEFRVGPLVGKNGLDKLRLFLERYKQSKFEASVACGLHIHFSGPFFDKESIAKCWLKLQHYIMPLSHPLRNNYDRTSYASFFEKAGTTHHILTRKYTSAYFTKYGTLEFRFPSPTNICRMVEILGFVVEAMVLGIKEYDKFLDMYFDAVGNYDSFVKILMDNLHFKRKCRLDINNYEIELLKYFKLKEIDICAEFLDTM